ncbi:hypothetical protein [Pseudomonas chlororaphis]|uniref:Uncharacterized protein n=1 Tax=Pseudomonas chlororaphis TaxID=587753 RepID=A0A1Q8EQF4_9PSED|nr:hypothetical protein [Pseudomonas chlororaphis]OLF54011.1 hypothetical protein BTN82_13205 [Pseudomonas chlororaphis]
MIVVRVLIFSLAWVAFAFGFVSWLMKRDDTAGFWLFGLFAYPLMLVLFLLSERWLAGRTSRVRHPWWTLVGQCLIGMALYPACTSLVSWVTYGLGIYPR